jgi:DNA-binding CsgD family transcriptional regulator
LSKNGAQAPIVVAIEIDEPALASQLAALLRDVPGLRLANDDERADVTMVAPWSPAGEGDMALTPRELEVLALVAEGASNKTIARRLGISVHTAKFHVGSLLDKLDATGRTDAVAAAARLGLIHL